MTPTERAEKIYNEYGQRGSWNLFDRKMIDAIASQIAEAEREAEEHGKKEAHRTMQGLQTVLQRTTDLVDGFDDGFTAARDQAAKIAGEHSVIHRDYVDDELIVCILSESIRAMEPPK